MISDGKPIVHKTFHSYVTRAKQGSSQYSRDSRTGNYTKSAGASLRRYNSSLFIQVFFFCIKKKSTEQIIE